MFASLIEDLASRPAASLDALPALSLEQLGAHPAGHANSIAWLLWHTGRELDMQTAELTGGEEIWTARGFRERLDLGELGDSMGYGHTPEQAAQIVFAQASDQQVAADYIRACAEALGEYARGLSPQQLEEIIDDSWDPPVSRGVRIVSVLVDALEHLAQAAYAAAVV